ncbi:hypothetical protein GCM10027416_07730 [Okibacterium endophyticum]
MEDVFDSLRHSVHRVTAVRDQAEASGIRGIMGPSVPRGGPVPREVPRSGRPDGSAERGATTGAATNGSALSRTSAATSVSAVMRQLSDESVTQLLWQLGELRRHADALMAVVSGEVSQRSRGGVRPTAVGLTQRNGYRAPAAMVQAVAGVTRDDAVRLVQVGEVIVDAEQAIDVRASVDELGLDIEVDGSWLGPIGVAVVAHGLSVAAAHALMRGLGGPSGAVPAEALENAAARLAADARGTVPDELYRRAVRVRRQLEGAVDLLEQPVRGRAAVG